MAATPLVLIVDDQPGNLDVLVDYLADSGLELTVATGGQEGLEIAAVRPPDLVLLDVMMPGMDGFTMCRQLKARRNTCDVPVIFMSALTDTESKIDGFAAGGIDFVSKPFHGGEVLARINAHLTIARQRRELQNKNRQLESLNRELQEQIDRRREVEDALHLADERLSTLTRQEAEHWGIDAFIGQSVATARLLDEVRGLQEASRTNVVVLGESGTGKELISRAIHYGSARRGQPFVAVNCSAIPAELADAEFFGHVKGAYTGASGDRYGYFVKADGGTLFLDEIGDMPLALQAKLLRVLEDGMVTPIGGSESRRVDVRVVAATNADIRAKVHDRQLRQDLYYRLAGYLITLPPLRERAGDIPLLAEHFLHVLGAQMGRERPSITREAMAALCRYDYPGNVRELRNLIEFALIASRGGPIGVGHLHFLSGSPVAIPEAGPTPHTSDEDALVDYARDHGRIDNAAAQALLRIDHGRASYLLKKLHKDRRLTKQGERRWTYYTAS